jgi:hypothetical protein
MISAVRLRRDPSKHFSTLKGHMAKTQAVVIGDSLGNSRAGGPNTIWSFVGSTVTLKVYSH